jgi:hypothetical protein
MGANGWKEQYLQSGQRIARFYEFADKEISSRPQCWRGGFVLKSAV